MGLRARLMAPRTYYVRPDGDDGNDGLTNDTGGAFATIQKAIDIALGTLDLDTFDVTIQLADGTYMAGATAAAPRIGSGTVTVRGNAANPENVVVIASSAACFRAMYSAAIAIKDMELRTVGNGVHALNATYNGFIQFQNLVFGMCGGFHIRSDMNGIVQGVSGTSYAITGGAVAHYNVAFAGNIRIQANTITLTGTPAFSSAFASGAINGCMGVNNNTYNGTATGKRYDVMSNAVINTNSAGPNYLPGDAIGTTAQGGQYT